MGQLGDLAKKEAEKRKAAGVEGAALDGLKKVTIVGGGKSPEELDRERRIKANEDSVAKQRAKNQAKKAATGGGY